MQVGCVVVFKLHEDVVDEVHAILADKEGWVTRGKYRGRKLTEALEMEFWEHCRKVSPELPEFKRWPEELPADFPSLDDGYYIKGNYSICLTHPNIV